MRLRETLSALKNARDPLSVAIANNSLVAFKP
jgi:hypothetical protein